MKTPILSPHRGVIKLHHCSVMCLDSTTAAEEQTSIQISLFFKDISYDTRLRCYINKVHCQHHYKYYYYDYYYHYIRHNNRPPLIRT